MTGAGASFGLWSLVIYGIVLIQPTAPMSPFGVVSVKAQGHVVTTILIGMVAMLFTAISYGRMARVYPSAGSGARRRACRAFSGDRLPAHLHALRAVALDEGRGLGEARRQRGDGDGP